MEAVLQNLSRLPNVVNGHADQIFGQLAAEMENYGKENRPWTDRTGNARRSITGTHAIEKNNIRAVLAIGVDYGVYLELSNGGKYRIVWPTIQQHRQKFLNYLKEELL